MLINHTLKYSHIKNSAAVENKSTLHFTSFSAAAFVSDSPQLNDKVVHNRQRSADINITATSQLMN